MHFRVTGMSCAACQARVEKAVAGVPGVSLCSVSLLTSRMAVEGTASVRDIVQAVEDAGYGAYPEDRTAPSRGEDALADRETPLLHRRLWTSLGFLMALMYCSMGHSMWGWPLPLGLAHSPAAVGLVQLLLAAAVMVINRKFFVSGWKGLSHRAPNMDTLVALGSSASFVWSVYVLIRSAASHGAWSGDYYFESAAMILVLITVGKLLEARSKGKTTDALRSLMQLTPPSAMILRDGKEVSVPVSEVKQGDIFFVRPGESIPVDGTVLDGSTAVNEAALTGESLPVDKAPGDTICAGTINTSGFIRCEARRVGEDTTLAQIIRLVSDAAATKAPIARTADRVSGVFVPVVMGIALVTFAVWLLLGQTADYALARGISVLVISCPCALGLATPVAIMVGNGVGARHGILFKTAASLENAGKSRIVVLDKTGTVTRGEPEIAEILPAAGHTEEELLAAAYALEARSEHPLAGAVVREAQQRGLVAADVENFRILPGNGLEAVRNGRRLCGGSERFIAGFVRESLQKDAEYLSEKGYTPLFFAEDTALLGAIGIADAIRNESAAAVQEMKELGLEVVLLTGDRAQTARAVGNKAGIEHVVAEVLPQDKAAVVQQLKKLGNVLMTGDGINDAPALTCADTGVAIGAGTDVAIDAADVVLMNSSLADVAAAIRLSRATLRNIRENLFWAFFYNALCIPLAAGCYVNLLGWQLNPMIAAAAMSLSSFCVVSNALRLNLADLRGKKKRRLRSAPIPYDELVNIISEINLRKEKKTMTKTMKIEGMMCPHCEARVKKTLEGIEGVESALVSHEAGTAVVTLTKEVADDVLKAAVDEQGYSVLGIE